MKAAFIRKTGSPDVIEWGDLPMPTISDYEVLVKVSAVTVNPIDIYYRSGKYQQNPPISSPYIIGSDMVGIVSKVGAKVTHFKVGQRVWSNSLGMKGKQGAFAEYVSVDADLLYHAPDNVDDQSIVAVLQSGATASLGLVREAMLKPTDTIFINGGGGNIAAAVIQLAKARGATVLTSTSSKEKINWCKKIGADLVLDYHKDNIEEEVKKVTPNGVNIFWDTSRNPNFDLAVSILGHKGCILLMAGSGSNPPFPIGPFYHKECVMKGFNLFSASTQELRQCADMVNLCLEKGLLKSNIAKVLPLSDAAKAHAMMEAKPEIWGKIILTV